MINRMIVGYFRDVGVGDYVTHSKSDPKEMWEFKLGLHSGTGEPPRLFQAKPSGGLGQTEQVDKYRRSLHTVFRSCYNFVFI